MLELNKPKPVVSKDDYWNSGFGDDFDDIPEARISEAASQSAHSSALKIQEKEMPAPVVIEDDYSFDEDPVIEIKAKPNGVNLRQGGDGFDFKNMLLNKQSSESSY